MPGGPGPRVWNGPFLGVQRWGFPIRELRRLPVAREHLPFPQTRPPAPLVHPRPPQPAVPALTWKLLGFSFVKSRKRVLTSSGAQGKTLTGRWKVPAQGLSLEKQPKGW